MHLLEINYHSSFFYHGEHKGFSQRTRGVFVNFVPFFRWNVYVRPSVEMSHFSARLGTTRLFSSHVTSPSYTCCNRSIVSPSWTTAGSSEVGFVTMGYRNTPSGALELLPLPLLENLPGPQLLSTASVQPIAAIIANFITR